MATQTPSPPTAAVPRESDPVAQTLALIQPWIDYVPKQQRRLGLFIFLALLVHLTAFFFIRIDTTRAELRRQPRPHVTIEDASAPTVMGGSPNDAFWDTLADPRLFLLPQVPAAGLTPDEPAIDFTTIAPAAAAPDFPPTAAPAVFRFSHTVNLPLEERAGESMVPPRQPFSYEENPRPVADKTTWQWGAALAQRQPVGLTDLPSPVSDTELAPTQLRVAVNPGGAVEHVFVEQSCGSGRVDLDQQAALAARKVRFHSTDQPGLLWGQVTVFWHYSAKPREEIVPTPPSGP